MNSSLANQIRSIIGQAAGMPEPQYDSTMEAQNWSFEFRQRLRACIISIGREADSTELAGAAKELEQLPPEVPDAIGRILARALYDNVNTPLTSA